MTVESIIRELLAVLLKLFELFIGFLIQVLGLILQFARAVFGSM